MESCDPREATHWHVDTYDKRRWVGMTWHRNYAVNTDDAPNECDRERLAGHTARVVPCNLNCLGSRR